MRWSWMLLLAVACRETEPRAEPPPPPPEAALSPVDRAAAEADRLRGACPDDRSPPCVAWRAAAEDACELGSMSACTNLAGALLDDEIGGAPDPTRARALAQRACDAGYASGCSNLGYAEHNGIGGPRDLPAARAHVRAACAQSVREGCNNLALYLRLDPDVLADEASAGYGEACRKGSNAIACAAGADLILLATTPREPGDEQTLRGLLAHACRLNLALACAEYADVLRADTGARARPDLADAIALHACHLGERPRCRDGERPREGAPVNVVAVSWYEPDGYEPTPLLDAIVGQLVPCAEQAGNADILPILKVAIDDARRVTLTSVEDAGPVEACIRMHFPTVSPTLGLPDGEVVAFELELSFGNAAR